MAADRARLADDVVATNKEPAVLARAARVFREADELERAEELLLAVLRDAPDPAQLRQEMAEVRVAQEITRTR